MMVPGEIYVKHTGKTYKVLTGMFTADYVVWQFLTKENHKEFFESFHTVGDVNYIDGDYYFRYEEKSYRYEIFFSHFDEHFILEIMSVQYDWTNSPKAKEELMATVSFLDGDVRDKSEYYNRLREIKIEKLLS